MGKRRPFQVQKRTGDVREQERGAKKWMETRIREITGHIRPRSLHLLNGGRQFLLPAGLYLSSEETGGVKVRALGGRGSVRETQVKARGEGKHPTCLAASPCLPSPGRRSRLDFHRRLPGNTAINKQKSHKKAWRQLSSWVGSDVTISPGGLCRSWRMLGKDSAKVRLRHC